MTDVISDIKGTLTYFDKQIKAEIDLYISNIALAMTATGDLRELDEEKIEILKANRDRLLTDKQFRKENASLINKFAEDGYTTGELNLGSFLRECVEDFFKQVRSDGGKIVLVGLAQPSTTIASLRTAGLDRYVNAVYQSGEVGSKADGTAFRTIAEKEGLDLSRCICIDDKIEQVEGALKVGVGLGVVMFDGICAMPGSLIGQYGSRLALARDFNQVKTLYEKRK